MKTKSGSGLIFAVVLLFVILGMVITLASVTVLETKMNQKTKSSIGAFYNSESGVEWALNKIANSSGTISGALSANPDGSVSCPISPDCKVYFLKSDGTVITKADFSTLTFNDIKAVRSVGTQGTGGAADTQRAIEAAVAGTGGGCYVDYSLATGTAIGADCGAGFKVKKSAGKWGYTCYYSSYGYRCHFRPAGGAVLNEPDLNTHPDVGEAYVCCL